MVIPGYVWWHSAGRKTSFYFPFTVSGSILFTAAVFLLGRGYSEKNFTALFISLISFGFLTLVWSLGRIQANRIGRREHLFSVPPYTYAGRRDVNFTVDSKGRGILPFFRLHLWILCRERVGKGSYVTLYKEGVLADGEILSVPFSFSLCGEVKFHGQLKISDIFGLTRNQFHIPYAGTLVVLPALLPEPFPPVYPQGGMDTKNKQKSSDEEKYYMREYIPGDRMRDINWKASSRSTNMITRISPVSQENTRTLSVDFRHYIDGEGEIWLKRENRDRIYHLDFLKSWFMTFLWKLKADHSEYRFNVLTGLGQTIIKTEDDILKMGYTLGKLSFQKDPGFAREIHETEEVYIFSTPFDITLGKLLVQYSGLSIYLYNTAFSWGAGSTGYREMRVFPQEGIVLPGLWSLKGEKKNSRSNNLPGRGITSREEKIKIRTL